MMMRNLLHHVVDFGLMVVDLFLDMDVFVVHRLVVHYFFVVDHWLVMYRLVVHWLVVHRLMVHYFFVVDRSVMDWFVVDLDLHFFVDDHRLVCVIVSQFMVGRLVVPPPQIAPP